MFCPSCGKADQKENTYCRQCGKFLPDLSAKNKRAFGGSTPEEQIRTNLILSLMSAVVSLVLAITLFVTYVWRNNEAMPIIYLVIAFLLAMSGWQISISTVNWKLRNHFKRGKEAVIVEPKQDPDNQIQTATTRKLLNESDLSNAVPINSVTEDSTRKLENKN